MSRGHVDRRTTPTRIAMIAGIAPVIECREQSAETERGGGSTAGQEGSSAPRTFKLGRGTYSAQSTTDDSTWVPPQLTGSLLVNMSLHPEVSSGSTAA